jgi:hypothetical protein
VGCGLWLRDGDDVNIIPAKWLDINNKLESPKKKLIPTPPLLFTTFPMPVATAVDVTPNICWYEKETFGT